MFYLAVTDFPVIYPGYFLKFLTEFLLGLLPHFLLHILTQLHWIPPAISLEGLSEFLYLFLQEFFPRPHRGSIRVLPQSFFQNFPVFLPGLLRVVSEISTGVLLRNSADVFHGVSAAVLHEVSSRGLRGVPSGDPNKILQKFLKGFVYVALKKKNAFQQFLPNLLQDFCRSSSSDFFQRIYRFILKLLAGFIL